jgi:expansin (peptidoglycan-binding protein)
MSRTLALFTAVVLAISAMTSAAPVNSNSLASPIENTVSVNSPLEKRKHHHHKHKKTTSHHKKRSTKKSSKKKTTKKTTKKSSSGSSSSSGTYKGTATWFDPASEGGSQGSCGKSENPHSAIVALNHAQYGNMNSKSSWCGKKISIKGPHGTTTATINDACPGCGSGSLDLTASVFEKVVGNLDIGVGSITWHLI